MESWLAGNVGGAWRVGDTVHRTTGPWTPAVHALLGFLAERGLPHVPHVLGFDEQGREILTYLDATVIESEALTTGQLVSLVSWTRHFHDAVADFAHDGPWRYAEFPDSTLVGHNDIAPYNVCFDGDELAGVFDWDLAGPTTPVMELAFVAWNCVPLWADVDDAAAVDRLELIGATYGGVSPRDIADAVPMRIQAMLDWIPHAAAGGDEGLRRLMTHGEPERSQRALDALVPRLRRLRARL